jgi:hypothetical protein
MFIIYTYFMNLQHACMRSFCVVTRVARLCHQPAQSEEEMKETSISLSERTFILEALKKENRIDGRRVQDIRTVKIAFREQYGSAEVQYGKTRYSIKPMLYFIIHINNKTL